MFRGLKLEEWGSEFGGLGRVTFKNMILCWPKMYYARAYARYHTGVLFFLLSQVSQRMELKILHHPKNDVSFYGK